MQDSRHLIAQACAGQRPERTPIFDLLCNDAVVAHFAGEPLNGTDDLAKMFRAAGRALDGTRAADVALHDNLYQVVAAGVVIGAFVGFLLATRCPCRRE